MNEKKTVEETEYEVELRRRLKILQEQFEAGKMVIREGLGVVKSLLAVKQRPDDEVDLSTVDGLVRSMALAVTAIRDREELKKEVPLSEIQNLYFNYIENNFGHFYEIMTERNLTPHDTGRALTQSQGSIEEITGNLDEFLSVIDQFWENLVAYGVRSHNAHVEVLPH